MNNNGRHGHVPGFLLSLGCCSVPALNYGGLDGRL